MSDCISRQAAIDALDEIEAEVADGYGYQYAKWREYFAKLPPAEPESAQWVQMLINSRMYKCSNCHVAWNKRLVFDDEGYSKNIFMKYCPCCGRKMQTEVDYE